LEVAGLTYYSKKWTQRYLRHVIQEKEKIEEARTEPIIFHSSSMAFRNTCCENSYLMPFNISIKGDSYYRSWPR